MKSWTFAPSAPLKHRRSAQVRMLIAFPAGGYGFTVPRGAGGRGPFGAGRFKYFRTTQCFCLYCIYEIIRYQGGGEWVVSVAHGPLSVATHGPLGPGSGSRARPIALARPPPAVAPRDHSSGPRAASPSQCVMSDSSKTPPPPPPPPPPPVAAAAAAAAADGSLGEERVVPRGGVVPRTRQPPPPPPPSPPPLPPLKRPRSRAGRAGDLPPASMTWLR